jgi:hypothetical protein
MLFCEYQPEVLSNPGIVAALVDAAVDAFARLGIIQNNVVFHRCSTGAVNSEMRTTVSSRCAGCGGAMKALKWLCANCRSERLTVRSAEPFLQLAWKGKNVSQKLNMVGSAEWRESLLLEIQFSEAFAVLKLCEQITNVTQALLDEARDTGGDPDPNVDLLDLCVDCSSAWRRPLGNTTDDWFLPSLGLITMRVAEESCLAWIEAIDSRLILNLRIEPPATRAEEDKIQKIKKDLALLIAAKMTITESPDPKKQLCPLRLERVNKAEFAASLATALEQAGEMRTLLMGVQASFRCAKRLLAAGGADEDDDDLRAFEAEEPGKIADLFDEQTRPPELDLQLARGSFPGALEGLVSLLRAAQPGEDVLRDILGWIQVFDTVADLVDHALQLAVVRIDAWLRRAQKTGTDAPARNFLETLKLRPGRLPHEGTMPVPSFFVLPACFDLVVRPAGAWERTGLGPKSERIVRLCSATWQLIGAACFEAPVMRVSHLANIAAAHHARSLVSCETLTQKSALANYGHDYDRAKKHIGLRDTIVEDDVSEALACFAPFSAGELGTFFGKILPTCEREVADRVAAKIPGMQSSEWYGFRDFIDVLSLLSAGLVKEDRLRFAEPHTLRLSKTAELLRAIPRIREWEAGEYEAAETLIPIREVRKLPLVVAFLVECAARRKLCYEKRVGNERYFALSTFDLRAALRG